MHGARAQSSPGYTYNRTGESYGQRELVLGRVELALAQSGLTLGESLDKIRGLSSTRRPRWTTWEFALPSAVAVILALPCLSLGYFWDDFAFLTRMQADPAAAIRYQPGTAFYRPLSQGIFFLALEPLGPSGALVAHLVNLALLLGSVLLLVSLVRSIAGRRAGTLAGLLFAGFAPAMGLVAWASGSQDLLAIFFLLAALRLHHGGRTAWAALAAIAGLLSKETIAVAWPVLVFWDWLIGRTPARVRTPVLAFGGVLLAWGLLHPGLRLFWKTGFFVHERPGYLGFRNLAVTDLNAQRYALTLFNLPATGRSTPWPYDLTVYAVVATFMTVVGFWFWDRAGGKNPAPPDGGATSTGGASAARAGFFSWRARGQATKVDVVPPSEPQQAFPIWRAALIGILLAVPMLVLPSLIIQRWVAYYACLPALGTAIFQGVLAARMPRALACVGLAAYLVMGTWCRGVNDPSGTLMTEQSFIEGSRAIRHVEKGFRTVNPTLPHGSQVLVSVASSKMAGIHGSLLQGQALRVWYNDPTIQTLTPEIRLPGATADYLIRVTPARDVVEIQPDRIGYRSSSGAPEPEDELRAPVRTYARGLAASGETDRSVEILERLAESDPVPTKSYDLRLAAMARFAAGERAPAESLRLAAPPISRDYALDAIAKVKAEPTRNADLDSTAYWAFEISPNDPDAVRYWMAMFFGSEYYPQAIDFARRLEKLVPGNPESAEVLRKLEATGK